MGAAQGGTYVSKEKGFWGETPAQRLAMLLRLCHAALDSYKLRWVPTRGGSRV